jgi:HD-like signal output (HDOD) protein
MIRGKIDFKSVPVQAGVISDIINLDIESSEYFQRLDDLIGADQGVASLVLRVVNSPLYSRGNKVGTIPLAISLLGYSVLRSLALLAFSRSLLAGAAAVVSLKRGAHGPDLRRGLVFAAPS